jgi:hypothetical protein
MHLVHCDTPSEPLELAPATALLPEVAEGDAWDAFWSADAYFVRCTSSNGAVEWFAVADDAAPPRVAEPRVLTLRTRAQSRVAVVIAKSPDGRRMLVGGSARRSAR